MIQVSDSLEQVIAHIRNQGERTPKTVVTCARQYNRNISFSKFRDMLKSEEPFLLNFGTAWGLAEDFIARADYILEPIKGNSDYNHLSVRAAAAIILDRVMRAY